MLLLLIWVVCTLINIMCTNFVMSKMVDDVKLLSLSEPTLILSMGGPLTTCLYIIAGVLLGIAYVLDKIAEWFMGTPPGLALAKGFSKINIKLS